MTFVCLSYSETCGADQQHFAGSSSVPGISAENADAADRPEKKENPGCSGEKQWVPIQSAQAEMMNRNGDAKDDQDLRNANLSLL